ncbi:MAG: tRNA(adenine34) deaminase [Moorella sp. (in: firmicutes)]|uniref:tRNA adenosine(34) deaminase TadA n=1 Tax=unclassified Neomoorella TaxID=2676739 RepID=UPI0010FFBB46|nr:MULTISPECIES: tRNA adenosine(34) deaminase TadA [unclassified Moorella (in: firmicutes)]MDK2817307.1 tRNA(adenine34) deaminase [Moorella sp. (in: firmicutes)]GEA14489.1 tRNA-specific adenosine deaminase [Moorella sp. E308F]GEA18139.1 tRNA-specific adenosine deaminase [Moorella sp. E306M]
MDHRFYMGEALAEAEKAFALGEIPIGAVIVEGERILARAGNRRETWGDPTAHAEIIALREAARVRGNWRLTGTTLYVTVEPCPMCAGALVQARVKRLVYGAPDLRAGAVDSVVNLVENPHFNHQVEVIPGIREEECRQLLKRFFQQVRRDG